MSSGIGTGVLDPLYSGVGVIVEVCVGVVVSVGSGVAVLFAVATGVRQGELLALRWRDVDLAGGTLTIQHSVDRQDGKRVLARPKSKKAQRTLALPELARRAIGMRLAQEAEDRLLAGSEWVEHDLVFPGPNGGIRDGNAVRRNFQKRLDSRGIEPIRWHALRRVFAALLQDQGVPLERIRDLMGHSELRVTESYAYTMPDTLKGDMSAIDDALRDTADATDGAADQ